MPPQLKTSSLYNLGFNKDSVTFEVEGQEAPVHLHRDDPAAKALEAFYVAALKELQAHQDKLGESLSRAAMEQLAREAALKGKSPVAPTTTAGALPSSSAKAGVFGWLRNRLKDLFSKPKVATPASPATVSFGTSHPTPPQGIRVIKEITESPVGGKVPALGEKEEIHAHAFRPAVSPPPARPATAPAIAASPAPVAAAAAVPATAPAPVEIKDYAVTEVYAAEDGVHITWNSGVSMHYAPEHPLSRLLLVAYEKMIESKVPLANVKEIASLWETKALAKGSPAARRPPEAKPASLPPRADPSEIPPLLDGESVPGEAPPDMRFEELEVPAESLPLRSSAAKPVAKPEITATPAEPAPEGDPAKPVAAAEPTTPPATTEPPVVAEPEAAAEAKAEPVPAPAPASPTITPPPAPTATAPAEPPAAEALAPTEVAALAGPAAPAPLPVRVINEDGSKVSIALWQKDGPPIVLNLDDIDADDIKRAINATAGPKLTHITRHPPTPDGRESLALHFDDLADSPGIPLAQWQGAPQSVTKGPAPASDGLPELPASSAKLTPGRRGIGPKELDS